MGEVAERLQVGVTKKTKEFRGNDWKTEKRVRGLGKKIPSKNRRKRVMAQGEKEKKRTLLEQSCRLVGMEG